MIISLPCRAQGAYTRAGGLYTLLDLAQQRLSLWGLFDQLSYLIGMVQKIPHGLQYLYGVLDCQIQGMAITMHIYCLAVFGQHPGLQATLFPSHSRSTIITLACKTT